MREHLNAGWVVLNSGHQTLNTTIGRDEEEGGGDGWGGDDAWDEFGSEYDDKMSYPTLTVYDRGGVKVRDEKPKRERLDG